MIDVAIIITNFNGKKFLNKCLASVYNQSYSKFRVILVDNGSEDNSTRNLKKVFPKIKIIKLDKNYGFAKASNIGIIEAFKLKNIKYVVCLNNDTIVFKNWLKELITSVKKSQHIGAVSSKAYFKDGKTIQNAGLIYSHALGINQSGGLSLGYGLSDDQVPQLSKDLEIFAPGGVAPLYKIEILKEVYKRDGEIFDEDFFAYVEDLDLGFRIKKLGYKSVLSSKAKLIHYHSQTGKRASAFKAYYTERNSVLTAIKNLDTVDMALYPIRNLLLKLSYLTSKHDSVEELKNDIGIKIFYLFIKSHLSAMTLLPKMIKKRLIINQKT